MVEVPRIVKVKIERHQMKLGVNFLKKNWPRTAGEWWGDTWNSLVYSQFLVQLVNNTLCCFNPNFNPNCFASITLSNFVTSNFRPHCVGRISHFLRFWTTFHPPKSSIKPKNTNLEADLKKKKTLEMSPKNNNEHGWTMISPFKNMAFQARSLSRDWKPHHAPARHAARSVTCASTPLKSTCGARPAGRV